MRHDPLGSEWLILICHCHVKRNVFLHHAIKYFKKILNTNRLAPPPLIGKLITKSNCLLARNSAKCLNSPPVSSVLLDTLASNVH